MSAKQQSAKQSHSKKKSSDICYVIKYVAEGPERECFYQDFESKERHHFCDGLNEATLFRSIESAGRTARALNKQHPASDAHVVLTVQIGVFSQIVLNPI
jgi:hypothetical protein